MLLKINQKWKILMRDLNKIIFINFYFYFYVSNLKYQFLLRSPKGRKQCSGCLVERGCWCHRWACLVAPLDKESRNRGPSSLHGKGTQKASSQEISRDGVRSVPSEVRNSLLDLLHCGRSLSIPSSI